MSVLSDDQIRAALESPVPCLSCAREKARADRLAAALREIAREYQSGAQVPLIARINAALKEVGE